MYILCIYCLFQVQRDLIFISIGFNLIMIRSNHVYFMYISSILGSKRFNFHFYWFNLVMIRSNYIYFMYILSI